MAVGNYDDPMLEVYPGTGELKTPVSRYGPSPICSPCPPELIVQGTLSFDVGYKYSDALAKSLPPPVGFWNLQTLLDRMKARFDDKLEAIRVRHAAGKKVMVMIGEGVYAEYAQTRREDLRTLGVELVCGTAAIKEPPMSRSKNTGSFSDPFPMSPKSRRTLIWIKASHTGRRSDFPRKTDG